MLSPEDPRQPEKARKLAPVSGAPRPAGSQDMPLAGAPRPAASPGSSARVPDPGKAPPDPAVPPPGTEEAMNRSQAAIPTRAPAAAVAATAAPSSLSREQFEQMTAELSDRLLATAMRLTRNRADAEDLVQDTMFRAWRSLATFQPGSLFRAWIFRILRNAFLNKVRHEQMAPDAVDPETLNPSARAETIPDIESLTQVRALSDRHFDDKVKAAVDSLPEVYRVPFLLFTLADMSYEEIAQTLDVPIGTVMSRLHRARAHLRERLETYAKDVRMTGDAKPAGDAK